jgi:chromosome segregation ATPase
LIEYLMLITLGACGASLIWLGLWPALARRTERLARRRIEATLPMSVAEFAGERDQLRAALAVKEARIEKHAEALAARHAEMLAQVGRANARLALLEQSMAEESKRHGETAAERERLAASLAGTNAAHEAETRAHVSAREQLAALEVAHRNLAAGHEALSDTADQRRLETAALQAEREALLGRLEGLEAAHRVLRADHAGLVETSDARHTENAVLKAEREMHLERLAVLEGRLGTHDVGLAQLGDLLKQRELEKTGAETRASDLATRLAASDAHGARLALDLGSARERLASLASLHQGAQQRATGAAAELETLRRELQAERERAEQAEAAERLHVANAVAELRKLEQALESEMTKLAAVSASLEEARVERDRLQAEAAKLATRSGDIAPEQAEAGPEPIAGEELAAREELVAMIERLADDIANASGVDPLPPVAAPRPQGAASRAAAE